MNVKQQGLLKKPYKKLGLSIGKKKTGGRNNQGRITAYHRGGGNKIRYIYLNQTTESLKEKGISKNLAEAQLKTQEPIVEKTFESLLDGVDQKKKHKPVYDSGEVRYLVRDPNRSAWVAGIYWSANKETSTNLKEKVNKEQNLWYSYYSNILAPEGLSLGTTITNTATKVESAFDGAKLGMTHRSVLTQTLGNKSCLKDLMIGTIIHNIDGKYIRAAGCSGIIISKVEDSVNSVKQKGLNSGISKGEKVTVKLQSGQYKVFSGETTASIGVISNGEHKTRDFRKAGQKRWLGRRPIVRGVAMNPIDHPHGGGEGKSSGGRPSVTPWGKPTKGKPTRSPKKPKLLKV